MHGSWQFVIIKEIEDEIFNKKKHNKSPAIVRVPGNGGYG